MCRILLLVLTSLLAFPLLANVPSVKIRVPVSKAIRVGDVNNFIAAYTEHGLQVNSVLRPRGYRLLHVAAREGSLEIVKHLIDSGAEVNATTEYDTTPLDEATSKEVIELLEQAGATYGEGFRIGVVPTWRDIPDTLDLRAALFAAAEEGATEEVVRLLALDGTNISAKDNEGWTALMYAALEGNTEIVKLLLERDANIETQDNNGWTALMIAAGGGNTEIVELLLERDANIEAKDNHGWTALMYAALEGNTEIVNLLLERDANIETQDNNGWTALMIAARWGNIEIVELLLERGADINAKNDDGWTALMCAARWGNKKIVELLLEHKAKVEARDK